MSGIYIQAVCLHTYTDTNTHNYNKTISGLYFVFTLLTFYVDLKVASFEQRVSLMIPELSLCRQAYGYRTEFNVMHAQKLTHML